MLARYNKIYKDQQIIPQNNNSKRMGIFSVNKNKGTFQVCHFSLKTLFVPKKRKKLRRRLKRIGRRWLRIKRRELQKDWLVKYRNRLVLS